MSLVYRIDSLTLGIMETQLYFKTPQSGPFLGGLRQCLMVQSCPLNCGNQRAAEVGCS
jgi:hypothetical protein